MTSPAEFPEIPQRELRNDASRVLREVRAGRSYTITVDGTPVADLVPHRNLRRRSAVPLAEAVAAFSGLSSAATISAGSAEASIKLPLFTVNPDAFSGLTGLVEVQKVTHPDDR